MKKIITATLLLFSAFSAPAFALDPLAPKAERAFGMVYVVTPKDTDQITLTGPSGQAQNLSPKTDQKVPVGNYRVDVKMDRGQTYSQDVTVEPTERFEVIVPGYGNLKVSGPAEKVTVLKDGNVVAEFAGNEVYTLPRGNYNLKILSGGQVIEINGVAVVTNTTQEITFK